MATATFIGLPFEVQEMIGPFLRPHDLTQCVLVNKTWQLVFNPCLWRHIEEPPQRKSVQRRIERGELEDWNSLFLQCTGAGALRRNGDLIQSIKFDNFNDSLFAEFLTNCPNDMRQLNSAEIGGIESDDDTLSIFLNLPIDGWKRLVFRLDDSDGCLRFGFQCVDAVQYHAETLEILRLEANVEDYDGISIQTLLCSAPLLRELYLMPPCRKAVDEPCKIDGWIIAEDIAEGQEWVCKELVVFGCQIGGIPRPDITRDIDNEDPCAFVVKGTLEASIEMQRGVYKQLARMKKLRELTLGVPYDTNDENYMMHDKECHRQYDCLSMTLESGLDFLKKLKNLEVVGLEDMEVYMNLDEEAWAVKHWPKAQIEITEYDTDRDYYSEEDDFEDEVFNFGEIPYILDSYTHEYLDEICL
ncbi:hypothetical protein BGZ96_006897 [Linnemannia gamsii]|uniref:F-box domain-containing protein n=1 Tax=Linnemannia gamsii TaxID=64522 RepID=A0ABQ7KE72_9FUNG|nr:hypothetical protein BGZ96_006897 [Linnemannia gamsii]